MKFDIATNDLIVDALTAFGEYKTYRQQCQDHMGKWGFGTGEARFAPFVLSLWEKSRKADAAIRKAGIEGISADSWLWATSVKEHLKAGRYGHCNVDVIREELAFDLA